jgi:hypothetical protein
MPRARFIDGRMALIISNAISSPVAQVGSGMSPCTVLTVSQQ